MRIMGGGIQLKNVNFPENETLTIEFLTWKNTEVQNFSEILETVFENKRTHEYTIIAVNSIGLESNDKPLLIKISTLSKFSESKYAQI